VDAVGVAAKSLRDWHVKLVPEPEPCGDDASAAAMQDESSVSESVCSELKWNVKF
jgi:hypothetical protein